MDHAEDEGGGGQEPFAQWGVRVEIGLREDREAFCDCAY